MYQSLLLKATEDREAAQIEAEIEKLIALVNRITPYTDAASGFTYPADSRTMDAIRDQQNAWSNYKQSECELVGSLSDAGNPWRSYYAQSCSASLTTQRLGQVVDAVNCLKRHPANQHSEYQHCLYPLAPLAMRSEPPHQ